MKVQSKWQRSKVSSAPVCPRAPRSLYQVRLVGAAVAMALLSIIHACAPDAGGNVSSSAPESAAPSAQAQIAAAIARAASELEGARVSTERFSTKKTQGKGYRVSGSERLDPECTSAVFDTTGHAFLFTDFGTPLWQSMLRPGFFADPAEISQLFKEARAVAFKVCKNGENGQMNHLSLAVGETDTSARNLVRIGLSSPNFTRTFTLELRCVEHGGGWLGTTHKLYSLSSARLLSNYPAAETEESEIAFESPEFASDFEKLKKAFEDIQAAAQAETTPGAADGCQTYEDMLFRQVEVSGLVAPPSDSHYAVTVAAENTSGTPIAKGMLNGSDGQLNTRFTIKEPGNYLFTVRMASNSDAVITPEGLWLAGSANNPSGTGELQWRFEIKAGVPDTEKRCVLEKGDKTLLTSGFGGVELRFIETISGGI